MFSADVSLGCFRFCLSGTVLHLSYVLMFVLFSFISLNEWSCLCVWLGSVSSSLLVLFLPSCCRLYAQLCGCVFGAISCPLLVLNILCLFQIESRLCLLSIRSLHQHLLSSLRDTLEASCISSSYVRFLSLSLTALGAFFSPCSQKCVCCLLTTCWQLCKVSGSQWHKHHAFLMSLGLHCYTRLTQVITTAIIAGHMRQCSVFVFSQRTDTPKGCLH